jgi:hypothetical protein
MARFTLSLLVSVALGVRGRTENIEIFTDDRSREVHLVVMEAPSDRDAGISLRAGGVARQGGFQKFFES